MLQRGVVVFHTNLTPEECLAKLEANTTSEPSAAERTFWGVYERYRRIDAPRVIGHFTGDRFRLQVRKKNRSSVSLSGQLVQDMERGGTNIRLVTSRGIIKRVIVAVGFLTLIALAPQKGSGNNLLRHGDHAELIERLYVTLIFVAFVVIVLFIVPWIADREDESILTSFVREQLYAFGE